MLNIYNFIESTKTLGPFNRFALWTQGCPFSCASCMTPDSQSFDAGIDVAVSDMLKLILETPDIEGITISGGEPFIQSEALVKLVEAIHIKREFGVIIYSGFTLQQLKEKKDNFVDKLLNLTDILIDGVYEESLNDGISLRGSSNQNIIELTNRYSKVVSEYYGKSTREIEIHMQSNEMMVVGIPKSVNILLGL